MPLVQVTMLTGRTAEQKRKLAHDEIDASDSLDHTKRQVRKLVDQYKQAAASQVR